MLGDDIIDVLTGWALQRKYPPWGSKAGGAAGELELVLPDTPAVGLLADTVKL